MSSAKKTSKIKFFFPKEVLEHKHRIRFLRPRITHLRPRIIKRNSSTFVDLYTPMPTKSYKTKTEDSKISEKISNKIEYTQDESEKTGYRTSKNRPVSSNQEIQQPLINFQTNSLDKMMNENIERTENVTRMNYQSPVSTAVSNRTKLLNETTIHRYTISQDKRLQENISLSQSKTSSVRLWKSESPAIADCMESPQYETTTDCPKKLRCHNTTNMNELSQDDRESVYNESSNNFSKENKHNDLSNRYWNNDHDVSRDVTTTAESYRFNAISFSKNNSTRNIRSRVLLDNIRRAMDDKQRLTEGRISYIKEIGCNNHNNSLKFMKNDPKDVGSNCLDRGTVPLVPSPSLLYSDHQERSGLIKSERHSTSDRDLALDTTTRRTQFYPPVSATTSPSSLVSPERNKQPTIQAYSKTGGNQDRIDASLGPASNSTRMNSASSEYGNQGRDLFSRYRIDNDERNADRTSGAQVIMSSKLLWSPPWKQQLSHSLESLHRSCSEEHYRLSADTTNGERNSKMTTDEIDSVPNLFYLRGENSLEQKKIDGHVNQIWSIREHDDRDRGKGNCMQYVYPDGKTGGHYPISYVAGGRGGEHKQHNTAVDDRSEQREASKRPPLLLKNKVASNIKYFNCESNAENLQKPFYQYENSAIDHGNPPQSFKRVINSSPPDRYRNFSSMQRLTASKHHHDAEAQNTRNSTRVPYLITSNRSSRITQDRFWNPNQESRSTVIQQATEPRVAHNFVDTRAGMKHHVEVTYGYSRPQKRLRCSARASTEGIFVHIRKPVYTNMAKADNCNRETIDNNGIKALTEAAVRIANARESCLYPASYENVGSTPRPVKPIEQSSSIVYPTSTTRSNESSTPKDVNQSVESNSISSLDTERGIDETDSAFSQSDIDEETETCKSDCEDNHSPKLSLNVKRKGPRLYMFLLELLQEPKKYSCIEWVNKEARIFKFTDSNRVASLWGLRKNKANMKFENFARSLRCYKSRGILKKPRQKLVYQFAEGW